MDFPAIEELGGFRAAVVDDLAVPQVYPAITRSKSSIRFPPP